MSYQQGGGGGGPSQQRSRVVFVGNLPFDYTEEQLIEVFSSVGPVVSFRLVFDHATGKPKGFGFCEYKDPETAASALRNLQGVDVGGRGLRLDFADTDDSPPSKRGLPGPGGPPGGPGPMGTGVGRLPLDSRPLPPGLALPPSASAVDNISQTLGAMPPGQLLDIMSQMKALVTTAPNDARTLLQSNPQLSYALFQGMLMMNIVDPAILNKMLPQAAPPPPQSYNTPPHYGVPPPQPQSSYGNNSSNQPSLYAGRAPPSSYGAPPHQQQGQGYGHGPPQGHGPPPPRSGPASYGGPPPSAPPSVQQPPPVAPEQAQLIQQVLAMTQEQIDSLPDEKSRTTIMQIRAQAGLRR